MLAVALVAIFILGGLRWHRQRHYRQMAAMHSQMEQKSRALVRSLTRRHHLTPAAALTADVNRGLAAIQRDRDNPRSLMAVGVSTTPLGFPRLGGLQNLRRQLKQVEAEISQAEKLLENQRKQAEVQAVYHQGLRKKYEKAADEPLSPVLPDPPPP